MALLFPFYISVKNRHSISHWYHTWYHIDTAFLWLIHLFVNKTNRWPPSIYVLNFVLEFISNLLYLLAGSGNSTWHDTESRDRSRRIIMLAKLSCFVSLVRVAASPIRVHRARVILSILWGPAVRRPMLRNRELTGILQRKKSKIVQSLFVTCVASKLSGRYRRHV